MATRPSPALPVRILGSGAYVPDRVVHSLELDEREGRPPGLTQRLSGVVSRRWTAGETTSQLAAAAVTAALAAAGLALDEVDALIVGGAIPEQPMPTTAVLTLAELGHGGGEIQALDVNATCLSFLAGLELAALGIAAGRWRRVALVGAEIASVGLNHADPESSGLFGDGAAAVVLGPSEGASAISALRFRTYPAAARLCEIRAGGTRFNVINTPPSPTDYLFAMDGSAVLRAARRHLPAFVDEVLDDAGVRRSDIDVIIPHQASGMGLRWLKAGFGFPTERIVDILPDRGNQVAASMPTALHHAIETGALNRGGRALLLGTAAGLLLGAAVVTY